MSIGTLIKTIQDIMRKDVGVDGDAQRISQIVWLLFLKIFDDKEQEWQLTIPGYKSPLQSRFRWSNWAKDAEGITGEELIDFVNNELFPSLKKLATAAGVTPHGKVIGSVFEDAYNYMKSGTLLRQVINAIEGDVDFNSSTDRHLFNDIYEKILADLQSAGNAGEYYTPRAVTQFMVDILNPQLGESVLDPACGTGGFLTCTIEHLKAQVKTAADRITLQDSIHGVEKKPLPHMLAMTNLMLHGIDVPSNIRHDNTLSRQLQSYKPSERVDIIITNPPFGGMEEDGIESNFLKKYQTRETADLFMALIMHLLKNDTGRAAVVLPDGFLFGEGVKTTLKRELLTEFNLHTVVRLPKGVFAPYTNIATNVLFFEKGTPTKDVWFFEHPYPKDYKSYSRSKPLTIDEFSLEKNWWGGTSRQGRKPNQYAWKVPAKDIAAGNYNLDCKNPHEVAVNHVAPAELMQEYLEISRQYTIAQKVVKDELMRALSGNERELLEQYFDTAFTATDGIKKLRELILSLAVQGKLVPQNPNDQPARELLRDIVAKKNLLAHEGKIKAPKSLSKIRNEEVLFSLPIGWEWVRLGEISEYIQRGKGPVYSEVKEIPVISQKCIQWSGFDKSVVRYIDPLTLDKYQGERFVQAGDLLWNSTGTGTIGRINIYNDELCEFERVVADSHVTVVRLIGLCNEFVLGYLMSPAIQDRIEENASGTTNQIELNTTTVINQVVPLPPLEEQYRIVAKVAALMAQCETLSSQFDAASKKQSELLSAVMAQM
jgi:type I restriction enzyme M protein